MMLGAYIDLQTWYTIPYLPIIHNSITPTVVVAIVLVFVMMSAFRDNNMAELIICIWSSSDLGAARCAMQTSSQSVKT